MARAVDTKEYLDMVCRLLAEGKRDVAVPVAGTSMCPFLRPEDTVYLEPAGEKLKKGRIYLFLRPNGRYVLHRLIRVESGGRLWMLGDSQRTPEPVADRELLRAQVSSGIRKGKPFTRSSLVWRFYAGPWRWLWRVRGPISVLWEKLRR